MNIISRSLFLIALLCCNYLFAQKTLIYSDPYRSYKNAQELFDKEKYSSAQFYFKDIINKINNPQDEIRINSFLILLRAKTLILDPSIN